MGLLQALKWSCDLELCTVVIKCTNHHMAICEGIIVMFILFLEYRWSVVNWFSIQEAKVK